MLVYIIFFILVIIVATALILYFTSYNKLSVIKIKMDNANNIISENLDKKYALMEILHEQINTVIKKKDYLKDFSNIKNKKLNNYELDKELNDYLSTMIAMKEDYKEINTKEYRKTLSEIKQIDQTIKANKVFFNKNNNNLIKLMKGHNKIVAKLTNISVKTSYEIKEPI